MPPLAMSLIGVLMNFSATLSDVPRDRILLVAEPSPGQPSCEEFFDKWEAPGAPTGMLAMAGLGREAIAAQDCIKQNKVSVACEHWSKLLVAVDRMGPPLNQNRADIEELMRQHKCDAARVPAK